MESSKTLTDVLDQLQSMELKFASVLLEAALKFATLADVNFFILFESSDGRYYGGKQYLCEGYRNGMLSSTGRDIELEADLETTSLKSKHMEDVFFAEPASPSDQQLSSPLQQSPTSTMNGHPSSPVNTDRRFKKKRPATVAPTGIGAIKHRKIEAEKETLLASVKEETTCVMEPYDSESEGGLVEAEGSLISEDGVSAPEDVEDDNFPEASTINAAHEPLTEDQMVVSEWFFNVLRRNEDMLEKIRSVKKLKYNDIRTMSNNESKERTEVFALFYDYGKHFSAKFLHQEKSRETRDYAFQILWSHLTNLHPYEELRVPIKYLSSSCKDSFLHPYRRRLRIFREKTDGLGLDV